MKRKFLIFAVLAVLAADEAVADASFFEKSLPVHLALAAKRHREKAKEAEQAGNKEDASDLNKAADLNENMAEAAKKGDQETVKKNSDEYQGLINRKRHLFRDMISGGDEGKTTVKTAADSNAKTIKTLDKTAPAPYQISKDFPAKSGAGTESASGGVQEKATDGTVKAP